KVAIGGLLAAGRKDTDREGLERIIAARIQQSVGNGNIGLALSQIDRKLGNDVIRTGARAGRDTDDQIYSGRHIDKGRRRPECKVIQEQGVVDIYVHFLGESVGCIVNHLQARRLGFRQLDGKEGQEEKKWFVETR